MKILKISDILNWVELLGTTKAYKYFSGNTWIRICEVKKTEGQIRFIRWKDGYDEVSGSEGGISENQLSKVASVFSRKPNYPIHLDRLFSASGNSRSALETLLALTPQFYICYPLKTNLYNGKFEQKLKHIMWCPDQSHNLGEFFETNYNQVISEVEYELDFGEIKIGESNLTNEFESIEAKKIHTQMQVALIKIGNALNFKSWIAANDRSIPVGNTSLGHLPGVVNSLDDISIFYSEKSKQLSSLIDCIWFSEDFKYVPAIIEVEHSTGVTSGLTRMLKLKEAIPSVNMSFTVVADLALRSKVAKEANMEPFLKLNTRYMSYYTVRELYGLVQRYNLHNVVDRTFIEPFMEKMIED